MNNSSSQAIYSPDQLRQYFTHIHLPEKSWPDLPSRFLPTLDFLSRLIRHQLCQVPFENLDLHYSPYKAVSLDPNHLFHKIVTRNAGRGGYCMQNNSFFATILRSLGYTVTSVGARVSTDFNQENPTFGGWSHHVNLITLEGNKYLVDVGFGSDGPTFPIPLVENHTRYLTGTRDNPTTSTRLTKEHPANSTAVGPEQRLWIYKVRYDHQGPTTPFRPKYCFTELEFFAADFNIMNHHVSTSRTSMFVNTVICMKMLADKDYTEIIGDTTLWGTEIKERRYGRAEKLVEIRTERDRTDALQRFLGVELLPEESVGIKGLPTAIVAAND